MQVEEVEEEASLEVSLDPSCLEEEKIPGFPGPSSSSCSWVNTKTVGLQVTLTSMLVHLGWVVIIVIIVIIIIILLIIVIVIIGIIGIIVILLIKGCIEYLTGAESFGASEFSVFTTGRHHL